MPRAQPKVRARSARRKRERNQIMYECPNCGGNLKFDIASQQLACGYCNTRMDPYSYQKEKDAEESAEYDVTVFTCPQCGAGLLSEDTTAATFCCFCGAATILDSRVGRERRPVHIIPFSRTKEDCKASYKAMMRRAIFAPKELKDEQFIEKFRGIYMPYWVYSFEKKGNVAFKGSVERQQGDYLITEHYKITSVVDSAYDGIAYDAAAAFSDDLSGAIAPFDMRRKQPFTPSFLSGFYADVGDVDQSVYQSDAQELMVSDGVNRMAEDFTCKQYHVKSGKNVSSIKNALRPDRTSAESAMLPVWFLSYRRGDRVAYAVVNGQTGKAAADLPVDRRKYVLGSLLLAVPIFLLLNLKFTITPVITLLLAAALAFVCAGISVSQILRIRKKEMRENDKGFMAAQRAGDDKRDVAAQRANDKMGNSAHADGKGTRSSGGTDTGKRAQKAVTNTLVSRILIVVIATAAFQTIASLMGVMLSADRAGSRAIAYVIFVILLVGGIAVWFGKSLKGHMKSLLPTLLKPAAAILLALAVLIWRPVSDLYYYGGAIASMGAVIWTLMDIIGRYNVLTTRKLPQFNKRGGD